jgi:hypothetical protein
MEMKEEEEEEEEMGVYDTRWLYIYIYNWEIG